MNILLNLADLIKLLGILCVFITMGNINPAYSKELPIEKIKLPKGFKISIYAYPVPKARSMALGNDGTVYVGTRTNPGTVFALPDQNKDYKADKVIALINNLYGPNGVAFNDGDLYVAEINRILKFPNIDPFLQEEQSYEVIRDDYPNETWHGWKYIAFGPDDQLYIPIGAPCNVCIRRDQRFASMTVMPKDGSKVSIYAQGIRNSVGFDWHPGTKELWFTDNGRDNLGDNIPSDELNRAAVPRMHFGFPYCHQGDLLDPKFGKMHSCDEFVAPVQKLGPHVASLGMKFYTGSMFPEEYHHDVFIAEHGSWNRSEKIGYRISRVKLKNNQAVDYMSFASGWHEGDQVWGRPVDILILEDGSMLISDDYAGAIYRINYDTTP